MRDYSLYLKDILAAIESIEGFVEGITLETFQRDDKTTSAVMRKLEIIGEATKRIPDDMHQKHSRIRWKEMAGMREKRTSSACGRAHGCGRWSTPLFSPPARGGGQVDSLPACGEGRGGETSPACGKGWSGATLGPIETLQPGDWVLAHDGCPHRVLRTFRRPYQGRMIGIQHEGCNAMLWVTADHRVLARLRPRSLGGYADWSAIPGSHFERARQLRREMTPPERKLWQVLRREQLRVKFRRQHPIGPYIADFYSRKACLVVEVDGVAAHSGEETVAHDRSRDAYLQAPGIRVLRIPASEVNRNLQGVFEAISSACREQTDPAGAGVG